MIKGEQAVSAARKRPRTLFDVVGDNSDDAVLTGFGVVQNSLMAVDIFPGHFVD